MLKTLVIYHLDEFEYVLIFDELLCVYDEVVAECQDECWTN